MDFDIEMAFEVWLDFDSYGPTLPNLSPRNVTKGMRTEDNLGMVIEWTDTQVDKVLRFYAEMHNVSK